MEKEKEDKASESKKERNFWIEFNINEMPKGKLRERVVNLYVRGRNLEEVCHGHSGKGARVGRTMAKQCFEGINRLIRKYNREKLETKIQGEEI